MVGSRGAENGPDKEEEVRHLNERLQNLDVQLAEKDSLIEKYVSGSRRTLIF